MIWIWAIHFFTPVKIRAQYGIPLFVRPSVHASYDNISHLFPLLLIGHVVRYIVLIKGGASERCDFSQFGKRQFSYGIYN
jgi:hypothetical protein